MYIFTRAPDNVGYFKDYERIEIILDNNQASLDTVIDVFKRYLLACGFQQESIDLYFGGE